MSNPLNEGALYEPAVPPGWRAHLSSTYRHWYFVNLLQNSSTWTLPSTEPAGWDKISSLEAAKLYSNFESKPLCYTPPLELSNEVLESPYVSREGSQTTLQLPPSPDPSNNPASLKSGLKTLQSVLDVFDTVGHWSGKGDHVEFDRKENIPLMEGKSLGRGASADVHEVVCRGVTLARKQIFCSRRMKLEDMRKELDILKKTKHKHVVTLIGSYIQGKVLGLLLYPAAVCDLAMYLDEIDDAQRTDPLVVTDNLAQMLERLHIDPTLEAAQSRLKRAYGCLAEGVAYLHSHDIRHKDIKTRNILLHDNDRLYITDFGISRDNTDASTSVTNGIERGTYKYCAPEVARFEPRGRAADVYSLGCVFLEMCTVYHKLSLVEFDDFRTKDGDHSFQNSQSEVREWINKIRDQQTPEYRTQEIFDVVDLTEKMLAENAKNRPTIPAIKLTLERMDFLGDNGNSYFSLCCHVAKYKELDQKHSEARSYHELSQKYRKVKQLYSEQGKKIKQLESDNNKLVSWLATELRIDSSYTNAEKLRAVRDALTARHKLIDAYASQHLPTNMSKSLSSSPTQDQKQDHSPRNSQPKPTVVSPSKRPRQPPISSSQPVRFTSLGYGSSAGWDGEQTLPMGLPPRLSDVDYDDDR